jgi:cell division transport system ATP-binding protein
VIFFDNVSKIYSENSVALRGVTLKVQPEEFVCLVGQSGAGKSTLLKMLLADEKPTEGTVYFDNIEVNTLDNENLLGIRRRIGAIFQDFKLLKGKTAFENVAFVMEACGKSDEEIHSDVPQVLNLVGLSEKVHHFSKELSGGEQQRVAIARALVNRPDVIIADEPTGNLDPLNGREIIGLLEKINQLGTTVILATHNKEVVDALGMRVVTMERGQVVRDEARGKYII